MEYKWIHHFEVSLSMCNRRFWVFLMFLPRNLILHIYSKIIRGTDVEKNTIYCASYSSRGKQLCILIVPFSCKTVHDLNLLYVLCTFQINYSAFYYREMILPWNLKIERRIRLLKTKVIWKFFTKKMAFAFFFLIN